MNKLLYTLCCISCLFFSKANSSHYTHELSICCIFRDDTAYLPEWVEFHESQGVEHIFLYENLSPDDYKTILKPYTDRGFVEIIPWHYEQNDVHGWNHIQCSAYMDCVQKHRKDCHWIAFIDTDEFLFNPRFRNIAHQLYYYNGYGGVGVNWVMYGMGNIDQLMPGEKMTKKLLYRSKLEEPANIHIKTIAQPRYVESCTNPHFFNYVPGKYCVDEKMNKVDGAFSKKNSVEMFRINHYWHRDKWFYWNIKIPRQKRWCWITTDEQAKEAEDRYNDVYDPILANSRA